MAFPGVAHPSDLLAGGDLAPAGGGDGGALPGGGGGRDGVPVRRREEDVLRLEIGVRQLAAIRSCLGPLGKSSRNALSMVYMGGDIKKGIKMLAGTLKCV